MSSYAGEDLFGSGPHRFHVGGLELRHVLHETPGGRGVGLSSQGLQGRAVGQSGELVADDPGQMQQLINAIEAKVDGRGHTLVDEHGRSWGGVVMVKFRPGPLVRVGGRVRVSYRVDYFQTTP